MIKEKISKEKAELLKKKNRLKSDFAEAKHDTRLFAILFVEFALSMGVVLSIYLYLDPETNAVPFPINIIFFAVLMALMYFVFNKTKEFRAERKLKF